MHQPDLIAWWYRVRRHGSTTTLSHEPSPHSCSHLFCRLSFADIPQATTRPARRFEYSHLIADVLTASTETTVTTLQGFFKAAVLYPDPMQRAQEELDRVVRRKRLPTWEDQANLPYMNALVQEVHRWATATPMASFHATSEADTYRGKYIPKGATVIANVYATHNDPAYNPEPEKFKPERFLDNPNLRRYAFSVGRRECPGQHVADASLYIGICRVLWAFNIKTKVNAPPPP